VEKGAKKERPLSCSSTEEEEDLVQSKSLAGIGPEMILVMRGRKLFLATRQLEERGDALDRRKSFN